MTSAARNILAMREPTDGQGGRIQALDYASIRILMEARTPAEQGFRLNACDKEPWTVRFIEAISPNSCFWDVGANVGSYSLIAAARGLNVVAIEPGFENYRSLCHNLALNNLLDRGIWLHGALAPENGFDWFHFSNIASGYASHILGGDQKVFFHRQLVPTFTLDSLFASVPRISGVGYFAKIDTDGNELGVLKGATACLAAPEWQGFMIECNRAYDEAVLKLMEAAGWRVAALHDQRNGQQIPGGMYYAEFRR